MVRGQNWSLLLREEVTFLMLITKFSCQTELFPQSLKEQKGKKENIQGKWRKKEVESDRLKEGRGDGGDTGD